MDEEAEDRLTELARTRLADTLSEAARLLNGPSPDDPPARRTERLGVDEVLLGFPKPPALGPVSAVEPDELPAASSSGASAGGPDPGGEVDGLRAEFERLRADVEAARQRVEMTEARAEEHEAALGDLRAALERLRLAGYPAPPYEPPGFTAVAVEEAGQIPRPERVPVVALGLGTILGQPPVTDPSEPATSEAEASEPVTAETPLTETAGGEPSPEAAAGEAEPSEPGADRVPVEPGGAEVGRAAAAGSLHDGAGGSSWPFVSRPARRRFWRRP